MSNLYKPTYVRTDPETGEKTTRRLRKWYGKYRDTSGVLQRIPLCTDKTAAQAMLADIVRKVERQQAGLVDPAADQLNRPIDEHITEYRTHLVAKATSEKHVAETIRIIRNVTAACQYRILADLNAGDNRLEEYLAKRHESGCAHRTVNADLIAVRSFCRWLLDKKRMHADPTSGLRRLREEEDRRLERRAMTDDEARALIAATLQSKRVYRRLNGEDRAVLYMLAQRTGLRRKELRSLVPASFDLECVPPIVKVHAAESKRRQKELLPLPSEVARVMADYLVDRDPRQRIWPGSWWRRAAEMLRDDLAEAGIDPVDDEGRVLDFHGQRTTFVTSLARAGVSPATAQRLARHSDVKLTMGTYTRLEVEDLLSAVEKLPDLRPRPKPTTNDGQPNHREVSDLAGAGDPRLGGVIRAWPNLPEQIRRAIVALIHSGTGSDRTGSHEV